MRRILALIALALAAPAQAHQTDVSRLELHVRPAEAETDVLFALPAKDLGERLRLDRSGEGDLDPGEVEGGSIRLHAYLRGTLRIEADGRPCAPVGPGTVRLSSVPTHIVWLETYRCPLPPLNLRIEATALQETGPYRHFARVQVGDAVHAAIFGPGSPPFELKVGRAPDLWQTTASYLGQGVLHILGGFDHLLFVICLAVVARSFRRLLGVITAFTAAHTITLVLAALEVLSLSPRVVEPAIAASIAFVAVENLLSTRGGVALVAAGAGSVAVTVPAAPGLRLGLFVPFLFGLVHGFGFSSVLREEVGLPTQALVPALVSFNVGVELGQVAVVAGVWPLARWAMRTPAYRPFLWVVNGGALVAALWWLATRLQVY